MSRRPWSKFYWADWRGDPRLRMCSRAARSLWLDLCGLMHEAEPYGHLLVAGIKPTIKQLASVLGDAERDLRKWLKELQDAGVYSETDDGTIYSRRMVRDHEKALEGRGHVMKRYGAREPSTDPSRSGDKSPNSPPSRSAITPEARGQRPKEKGKNRSAREPHERWEEFRQSYPDRGGGPMGWNEASGRFSALVEAKHATADELIGAAKAYRAAMAGKQDRSVVQQASTFLGPQKATWREYVGKPAELALAHPNLPSWHDANAKASG